jgi:hypothetical protein
MSNIETNPKKLVRINRGEYLAMDQSYRIQYFTFKGGSSEWVISSRRSNGWYFAVDHAPTLEDAQAKYLARVSA